MKPFKSKKHKKKVNHLILFTSDAVDSKVRQIRLSPGGFRFLMFVICIIAGVLAGYFVYGGTIYQHFLEKAREQEEIIAELNKEKELMTAQNAELNEKVAVLSETVNQKVQAEQEAEALDVQMSLPTDFPLTGSAQVEETTIAAVRAANAQEDGEEQQQDENTEDRERPVCIFTASEGTTLVSSGNGTVASVGEDADFGYRIVIDHGNGYQSVYLNRGEPMVKEGDSVNRGVTLYVIGGDNATLGYQITQEGVYVNPMEMIAISG